MTVYNFEKIQLRSKKDGMCDVCNQRAVRRQVFYETSNPFNVNPDGSLKTREQIMESLRHKIKDWHSKPVRHVRCE